MKVTYDIASCAECPFIEKVPSNRTKFFCCHCYGIDTVGVLDNIHHIPDQCPVKYLNDCAKREKEIQDKKLKTAIEALENIMASKQVAVDLEQSWVVLGKSVFRTVKDALNKIKEM